MATINMGHQRYLFSLFEGITLSEAKRRNKYKMQYPGEVIAFIG